jgi:hypothetical protein
MRLFPFVQILFLAISVTDDVVPFFRNEIFALHFVDAKQAELICLFVTPADDAVGDAYVALI